MRIRTLTELNEHLNREFVWRRQKLTTLKFAVAKARSHEQRVLLRMAICCLYAHWEGFIKAAAAGYISFVATRGLRYRDLASNFIALGIKSRINAAGQSNSYLLHTELTEYLISGLSDRASIDWEHAINTQSNLNSKVLRDILCVLGLEETKYLTKSALIDQRLLDNRNKIAHGEYFPVDENDYEQVYTEIMNLIEQFRTDIENAAVLENYKRSSTN